MPEIYSIAQQVDFDLMSLKDSTKRLILTKSWYSALQSSVAAQHIQCHEVMQKQGSGFCGDAIGKKLLPARLLQYSEIRYTHSR